MLTKNFYTIMMTYMFPDKRMSLKNVFGSSSDFVSSTAFSYGLILEAMKAVASKKYNFGIVFSKDSTTPKPLDYVCNDNLLEDVLTVTPPTQISINRTNTYIECAGTYAVKAKNIRANINSVGLYGKAYDTSGSYSYVLLDRSLLETPITLQPGESKQITYTIRFNYPGATA